MAEERIQHKLTTIVAADVEGFSRLMSADEEAMLKTLKIYREIIDSLIAKHDGRLVGTAGNAVLVEFGSDVRFLPNHVRFTSDSGTSLSARSRRRPTRNPFGTPFSSSRGSDALGPAIQSGARKKAPKVCRPSAPCKALTYRRVGSLSLAWYRVEPPKDVVAKEQYDDDNRHDASGQIHGRFVFGIHRKPPCSALAALQPAQRQRFPTILSKQDSAEVHLVLVRSGCKLKT